VIQPVNCPRFEVVGGASLVDVSPLGLSLRPGLRPAGFGCGSETGELPVEAELGRLLFANGPRLSGGGLVFVDDTGLGAGGLLFVGGAGFEAAGPSFVDCTGLEIGGLLFVVCSEVEAGGLLLINLSNAMAILSEFPMTATPRAPTNPMMATHIWPVLPFFVSAMAPSRKGDL
jgi:hypothetical protein